LSAFNWLFLVNLILIWPEAAFGKMFDVFLLLRLRSGIDSSEK
jgi:hypothetical protein